MEFEEWLESNFDRPDLITQREYQYMKKAYNAAYHEGFVSSTRSLGYMAHD